ncbi:MAG TPA: FGGY family carbohydrate kinase [Acidimicrobiales bacterium]|nr:FGGY family carbohydrate kinase [Acidimicrobiales bacterium]
MILTVDLGSSVTKVALWGARGLEGLAGVPLRTAHPRPGWSEQDPHDWWASLTSACGTLRAEAPAAFASIEVIGCTGARQTVVLADADGGPLGPAILWSDRRAGAEATTLATAPPADAVGENAGPAGDLSTPIDAASVAAKLAWLSDHEGERLDLCAWILSPRDLVAWWLTGVVATDPTMASRSGLYDPAGNVVAELAGDSARKLAPVVPSEGVTGALTVRAAEGLGLTAGTPVVIGAGDRPCEVIGSGATESGPMVSWGTTANVSMPVRRRPDRSVPGLVVSRAADDGWLIAGGLSSAGSLIDWLGRLTGHPPEELADLARGCGPGAGGVVAVPWLDGARAPWWRDDATAGFAGLRPVHGPAELARAVFESVAWDLQRCLEIMSRRRPAGPPLSELRLGGSGSGVAVWTEVLTGTTGLPVTRRRSGQAASAGAAVLAARAVGMESHLDLVDPPGARTDPEPGAVAAYRSLRQGSDRMSAALLGLARGLPPAGDDGRPDPGDRPCA